LCFVLLLSSQAARGDHSGVQQAGAGRGGARSSDAEAAPAGGPGLPREG
jgi:hypothetical protein